MGMSIAEYKKIIQIDDSGKRPNRQLQGRINHELGKNFEEQVEFICKLYEDKRLARIEKTPEPMRILKHVDNGHFEAIFTKSAQPDFKGTIKGGKTVVFDAKFTESEKITYSVLSDFQRETLLFYSELGAIAFVLVGFVDGKIFKIDIDVWNNMKERFGRKYIRETELEELNFELGKTGKEKNVDFFKIL